jgi:hypothetical protein
MFNIKFISNGDEFIVDNVTYVDLTMGNLLLNRNSKAYFYYNVTSLIVYL